MQSGNSRINALLVDQMEEQRFVESLAELRNRYQEQAHECERKASHAKSKSLTSMHS
jgi:hypothetical protein